MKIIGESVVTAFDGSDKEVFTYLPYILQDSLQFKVLS